jgi:DNA-binding Lrp family transcriptional regulator
VAAPAFRPEALDLDILREMYRNGAANLAGIDPRVNATRIARRLKVGRARVAARLKVWSDSGFLQRYDVWLNPALFRWHGAWIAIQVEHPRRKRELFSRLALVDGAVSGIEFLGPWISFGLVAPDPASLERTVGLLRGLAGVAALEPPQPWRLPEPRRDLTPLDLRIVRALRERPTASLGETARRVGISTRTMTRRYAQLLDHDAVWFVPVFDFRAIAQPVVSVGMNLDGTTSREAVVRQVRSRFPLLLEFENSEIGPQLANDEHVLFVLPPSAAHLEELEEFVASVKGVRGVETNVLVRSLSFPAWFDRHLESLARPRA